MERFSIFIVFTVQVHHVPPAVIQTSGGCQSPRDILGSEHGVGDFPLGITCLVGGSVIGQVELHAAEISPCLAIDSFLFLLLHEAELQRADDGSDICLFLPGKVVRIYQFVLLCLFSIRHQATRLRLTLVFRFFFSPFLSQV